jgi:hypothetical protein
MESTSDALILFSPVSVAELWAGARPAEYETLEALFDALVCVPADTGLVQATARLHPIPRPAGPWVLLDGRGGRYTASEKPTC